jgi:FkbM family methyltransferase
MSDIRIEMLKNNRTQFENICRKAVNPIGADDGLSEITVLNDFKMYVFDDDISLGQNLKRDGYWEFWISKVFINIIQPGWTVFDIGANYGYYTFLFSRLVGENGEVFAFEPNISMTNLISAAARLNGMENIEIVQKAVSSDISEEILIIPKNNYGDASIVYGFNAEVEFQNVSTVTLDSFHDVRAQLIKIDAEGSDEEIIWGAKEYIRNYKPIIVMEWVKNRTSNSEEFYEFFQKMYYRIYRITELSTLKEVTPSYLANSEELDMLLITR